MEWGLIAYGMIAPASIAICFVAFWLGDLYDQWKGHS